MFVQLKIIIHTHLQRKSCLSFILKNIMPDIYILRIVALISKTGNHSLWVACASEGCPYRTYLCDKFFFTKRKCLRHFRELKNKISLMPLRANRITPFVVKIYFTAFSLRTLRITLRSLRLKKMFKRKERKETTTQSAQGEREYYIRQFVS